MLTQELTGIRNGKTRLLLNIARGANSNNQPVLFIVPINSRVYFYRKELLLKNLDNVEVVSYQPLRIHRMLREKVYDYILMDDTQAFVKSEGDPVIAIEALFRHLKDRPVIISARSTQDI